MNGMLLLKNPMLNKKRLFYYYVGPRSTNLKFYKWMFATFNIKFKNTKYGFYNEIGFRIFGWTFIWTN